MTHFFYLSRLAAIQRRSAIRSLVSFVELQLHTLLNRISFPSMSSKAFHAAILARLIAQPSHSPKHHSGNQYSQKPSHDFAVKHFPKLLQFLHKIIHIHFLLFLKS